MNERENGIGSSTVTHRGVATPTGTTSRRKAASLLRSITAELANVDDGRSTDRPQPTIYFPHLEKLMLTTPTFRQIRREKLLDPSHLDHVVHCWNDIAVPTLFGLEDNDRLPT